MLAATALSETVINLAEQVWTGKYDLGTLQLHGDKLEGWLEDVDFMTYSSVYGAKGTAALERPNTIRVRNGNEEDLYLNPETGREYSGTLGGSNYTFTIKALAPRTLEIDTPSGPVINVRDVGSWPLMSTSGKKMNQGVILRGGNLDGFIGCTEQQKTNSFLTTLGIKTEIELRPIVFDQPAEYSGVVESFAAVDCAYVDCGIDSRNGGRQISSTGPDFTNQIRRVFSTWGTSGNLPSYFHCKIGTDRTGIVGLLLLGMMGVEEEVLYRDYLMSNFANIGVLRDASVPETFLCFILRGDCGNYRYTSNDDVYGKSVASRCRQYLEMCGVTEQELDAIATALSGETADEILARVNAYETANDFRTVCYVKYAGSSTTNAIHRLAAGKYIIPAVNPTRTGYVFRRWDTENPVQNDDGTYCVYAIWEKTFDRYWSSDGSSTAWSDAANWAESSDGATGQTAPGYTTSSTYWRDYKNGATSFDAVGAPGGQVCIDTYSSDYFVWSATNPAYGISAPSYEFKICQDSGKSPAKLQIDSGTYSFAITRIGCADNATAELLLSGGTLTTGKARVGGSAVGTDGTLTIKSGTFQTSATGDDVFMICDQANTRGTLVIDGGTLDTTSGNPANIGGVNEIEANIYVNAGGVWNAKGFFLGGKRTSTKYDVTNVVTRLYVNGGTLSISNPSGIGYAVGEGSSAEMVVNAGIVTISGTDAFYVGESGPGSFTMNGGVFTMVKQSNGFGFGHARNGHDVGTVTLNGGVLNIYKFRLDYVQPGSKVIFNGGTIRPLTTNVNFLDANGNLECVIDEGGLVVDTAGFDITIAHQFAAAEGKAIGGITKRGNGTLTLTEPFDGAITVLKGSVVTNLVTEVTDPETGEVTTERTPITISANLPAATDRHWLAATTECLASDSDNWSTSSGGTPGADAPDWDYVGGTIYFDKAYENGVTVLDKAIEPVTASLNVGSPSEAPLVWRATLPYCGFSYLSGDWILAYDSNNKTANLTIDSGTYACDGYFRVGYTTGGRAEFVMKGGNVTVAKPRVAGANDDLVGTIAISNGTFTVTESLYITSGGNAGATGKLIVDGGTLDTTAPDYVRIGQNSKQATAMLQVKSGTWNTTSFLVGGETKKAAGSYAGLMAYLIVDGGAVNASGYCSIGANIAADARSEMIVNGGSVNINSENLYVGDGGPGYLTINGGTLTMKDSVSSHGINFGHMKSDGTGGDFGVVTLNGGTLRTPMIRVKYIAPGSKLVFNGGTLKATRSQPDFLPVTDLLTCEMQAGGIVFDTDGFDVTSAHDIVRADGVSGTTVVKKGGGELTFSGAIDPDGGFSVEEGKLALKNLSCAWVERISVADGAALDINGAEVATKEYWLNGERQPGGTYRAHNGTIYVASKGVMIICR